MARLSNLNGFGFAGESRISWDSHHLFMGKRSMRQTQEDRSAPEYAARRNLRYGERDEDGLFVIGPYSSNEDLAADVSSGDDSTKD
jgi:hypothetical protein